MTTTDQPLDIRGMLLIHRVLRREIGQLPAHIRGAAGDRARAARIAAHGTEMLDFLHTHHHGEDELVWPLLRARVTLDAAAIDRMEAQHREVAAAADQARSELPAWAATADAAAGERIAGTVESMDTALREHLEEEETQVLPVIATTLSQSEWDALADHGFAAIPGKRRMVMLGHILEEADEDERAHMLTNVPRPARLAFRAIGRRQFAREAAAIRRVP